MKVSNERSNFGVLRTAWRTSDKSPDEQIHNSLLQEHTTNGARQRSLPIRRNWRIKMMPKVNTAKYDSLLNKRSRCLRPKNLRIFWIFPPAFDVFRFGIRKWSTFSVRVLALLQQNMNGGTRTRFVKPHYLVAIFAYSLCVRVGRYGAGYRP